MYSKAIYLLKEENRERPPGITDAHCDQGGPRNCVWMCLFGGYREGHREWHRKAPPLASNSVKDARLQYVSTSAVVVFGPQRHNFHLLEQSAQFSTNPLVFSSKYVISNLLIFSLGYSTSYETFGVFVLSAVSFFFLDPCYTLLDILYVTDQTLL